MKPDEGMNGGGEGALRTDVLEPSSHRTSDIRMVNRAIRERWRIPEDKRNGIVDRLVQIVDTEKTNVSAADGSTYESYDAADKNSVAAARVLVAMEGQNQADTQHVDKQKLGEAGLAIDAMKALSGMTEQDKLDLVRRAGMTHLLPNKPEGQ